MPGDRYAVNTQQNVVNPTDPITVSANGSGWPAFFITKKTTEITKELAIATTSLQAFTRHQYHRSR